MKKPTPIKHIKDPKKVAAGKARAASAIKDKQGKYISKLLYNEVARVALAIKGNDVSKINAEQNTKIAAMMRDAKVTAKEVKELYTNNPIAFESIIENGNITGVSRNSNQVEKSITDFTGIIHINGKEVSKAKAKKMLMEFKQYLSINLNVVDFTIRPILSFDGVMSYEIPDVKKLTMDVLEYFDLEHTSELDEIEGAELTDAIASILDGTGNIVIYSSDKKKRKQKARDRRQDNIVHKQVSRSVKAPLCGTKGIVTYTLTAANVTCEKCLNKMYK